MKQGLISGTYHIKLSKKEMEAVKMVIQMQLPLLRVREPQDIYKDVVETLENVVPKFTP